MINLRQLYSQPQSQWPDIQTADNRAVKPLAPLKRLKPKLNLAQVALGEKLFHDQNLSRDNSVSCANCHEKRIAFSDARTVAIGIKNQPGNRNTQAIFAIDHWTSFFWDGRVSSPEQQAIMPIENPLEMDLSITEALIRINSNPQYLPLIQKAFAKKKLNAQDLGTALAEFERSLPLPNNRFTEFIAQTTLQPQRAIAQLNDAELHGLHLFRTKAKCMTCHNGALLSDNQFHNTGLSFYGRKREDLGRYQITNNPDDVGKFRTPSLLMLNQTSPWMHNGLFTQMLGIVRLYNAGGARPKRPTKFNDDPLYPQTSSLLHQLNLTTKEQNDLVSFLEML
ncbi:cytochrome-c peroxidase [Shewanella basaltis]|uniref:cytochrome-c peroxidase n=1 Tax=Shewanella basaltis TaxID=472183 RepID=UPI00200F354F|nr:cytochrome c peroxidase [Shewanella basaltis]MCL1114340.1 cytochrome-c peroxidase [Shewanella basaltis]